MAWYNSSWLYRQKITVDNTKVSADLTDFPVYVDLADMETGFFTHVKTDGSDIRVTKSDGITEVPRQVAHISIGGTSGELHFKADGTLSSSADTDYYIYYGNAGASEPAASATYGSDNAWDSNFANVYHLQEDPSGSAPQIIDSTGNSRDGTTAGSMTTGQSVGFKIEKGLDFDGSNDHIAVSSFGMSAGSSVTVEAWVNLDTTTDAVIVDESNTAGYGGGLHLRFNSGKLVFWSQDAAKALSSTATFSTATNYYVAAVYNGTNNILYLDGAQDSSSTPGALSTRNAGNPRIGNSAVLSSGSFRFNGRMDELRISSTGRTADWILTSYNNQNSPSTFYSVGAEETDSGGSTEQPAIFFGCVF
jgi:hypothetical protein